MKTKLGCSATQAFTLIEALILVVVFFVVLTIFVPARLNNSMPSKRMKCVHNLKNLGLAFEIFEVDNGGLLPMMLSNSLGGTLEYKGSGPAYRHFQVLSNELSTTKIVICPADKKRKEATNWFQLRNENVSYLVGTDATPDWTNSILSGDHNLLINGKIIHPGTVAVVPGRDSMTWGEGTHMSAGNILLGDGSVQQTTPSRLMEIFKRSAPSTNHLCFP